MNKKEVLSIQYMRGIAALLVVFYHTKWFLDGAYAQHNLGTILFGFGAFGVDLFFVISGFIICLSTEKTEKHAFINFFIRRFFRIYPLLIISVISFFFLIKNESSYTILFKSLIPIHIDYSKGSPFFGYNLLDTVWTISYEIAFYILFGLSILISKKYRIIISIILILTCFILSSIFFNNEIYLNAYLKSSNSNNYNIFSLFYSPMFIDFIYGILIYVAYKNFNIKSLIFKMSYPYFIILLMSLIISQTSIFNGHGPLKWGAISAFIILLSVCYEKNNGFWYCNSLKYLGDISYSIYIIHVIILRCIYKYDTFLFPNISGISRLIIVTSLIIIASILTHELIEKKAITLGKKLLRK